MEETNFLQASVDEVYWNKAEKYGESHILGSFVLGPANYGFFEMGETPRIMTILIPSFDELCLGLKPIESDVIDIRDFYYATTVDTNGMLEYLFCSYFRVNGKYWNIFKKDFLDKRELISHFCPKLRLQKAREGIEQSLQNGDMFEVFRLYNAATRYSEGVDTYFCFHETDEAAIELMWKLKKNEATIDVQMILSDMNQLIAAANGNKNFDVDLAIRNGILNLMNCALYSNTNDDAFKNSLSEIERQAYDTLFHAVGNEGTVPVSHLVAATGISKGTYQKLLKKLNDNGICVVESRGVKGTYVKRI